MYSTYLIPEKLRPMKIIICKDNNGTYSQNIFKLIKPLQMSYLVSTKSETSFVNTVQYNGWDENETSWRNDADLSLRNNRKRPQPWESLNDDYYDHTDNYYFR